MPPYPRIAALALALFAPAIAAAQAAQIRLFPYVVDESNAFTASWVINQFPTEVPTTHYKVEISRDLQTWDTHYFRYNAHTRAFTQTDYEAFTATHGFSIPEAFAIEITVPAEQRAFLRIAQLEDAPEGQRFLSEETRNLLANLHRLANDPNRFAFGQEFPLSYSVTGNTGNGDLDDSDAKDVVGDHPGVHGSDFEYMLDRPWEEAYHIAAVRKAYQDGAIVTFDWHWDGKYGDGGYRAHPENDTILDYVVRDDDSRGDVTWFYEQLDRVVARINDDLQVPFVFRPFHEMDGNWFWWGRQMQGGAATYRDAYRLLVDYVAARTDSVLFCWSPDIALADFEQFYPGDAYVDVCGRDIYNIGAPGRSLSKLTEMIDFAEARGKVAVFSETGHTTGGSFEDVDPDWWTTRILEPIRGNEKAGRIAWVLTWINAQWSGPYIPHANSPQAAKDDFQAFHDAPETLFQADIAALDVYAPPPPQP